MLIAKVSEARGDASGLIAFSSVGKLDVLVIVDKARSVAAELKANPRVNGVLYFDELELKLGTGIVCYVVAKAKSKAESPACYTAVKEYWKVFVKWAQARGVDRMKPGAIAKLQDKNADLFPLFLKEKK